MKKEVAKEKEETEEAGEGQMKWCVVEVFGRKIKGCVPASFAERFCKDGVAYSNCNDVKPEELKKRVVKASSVVGVSTLVIIAVLTPQFIN